MILDDDSDPKTKKQKLRILDNMSVPELREYIQQLKEEIARAEADIQKNLWVKFFLQGSLLLSDEKRIYLHRIEQVWVFP